MPRGISTFPTFVGTGTWHKRVSLVIRKRRIPNDQGCAGRIRRGVAADSGTVAVNEEAQDKVVHSINIMAVPKTTTISPAGGSEHVNSCTDLPFLRLTAFDKLPPNIELK